MALKARAHGLKSFTLVGSKKTILIFQSIFVYIGTCRFATLVFRNCKTYVRVFDFESPEKLEKSLSFLRVCLALPYDKVFGWSKHVC